jgi:hypothetical protein
VQGSFSKKSYSQVVEVGSQLYVLMISHSNPYTCEGDLSEKSIICKRALLS